ncbi:hypothetical protein MMC28_006591 [Mycoblastus sanguinarius]|nr:hypothetical protein [Mycoblastus sanguinarius]
MPAVHSVTEDAPTSDHSIEGSNPSSNYCNGHAGDYDGGLADYVNSKVSDGAYGSNFGPSPIAICGLALRLPGGIHDADSFWDVLVNGKDMRGPIPADRYNPRGFDDTLGNKGAIKTQHGYFIDEDLSNLDASFFSMTQNELEKTDPQQRQILEVTRECLENAGEVDYRGKPVGCYVGTFGEDWLQISAKESQHSGGYIMTGHGDLMIANRVSFEFDFQGPR